jgi:hypothetical protein
VRWQDEAACRGLDPAEAMRIFFPARGERNAEAVDYCNACPVRQECLDDALAERGYRTLGVWGGMSERQRRSVPQKARVARVCALNGCPVTFTPTDRRQLYCTPNHAKYAANRKWRANRRSDERRAS